jgi:excisionase family DNA binding protein
MSKTYVEKLLDKRALAEVLGVTLKTVDKWVSEKRVPFIRITGKCVRFVPAAVQAYLESKTVAPDPPPINNKPRKSHLSKNNHLKSRKKGRNGNY